jgi:hypothetical protein
MLENGWEYGLTSTSEASGDGVCGMVEIFRH